MADSTRHPDGPRQPSDPVSPPAAPPREQTFDPREHRPPGQGDATGGVIPYKNPAALAACYLGLFSLLPVVGIVLAILALILGIVGLRRSRGLFTQVLGSAAAASAWQSLQRQLPATLYVDPYGGPDKFRPLDPRGLR